MFDSEMIGQKFHFFVLFRLSHFIIHSNTTICSDMYLFLYNIYEKIDISATMDVNCTYFVYCSIKNSSSIEFFWHFLTMDGYTLLFYHKHFGVHLHQNFSSTSSTHRVGICLGIPSCVASIRSRLTAGLYVAKPKQNYK